MNNKYKYKGMWPVAPTPFHENGEVDYEGMGRVIDCMVCLLYTSPSPRDNR